MTDTAFDAFTPVVVPPPVPVPPPAEEPQPLMAFPQPEPAAPEQPAAFVVPEYAAAVEASAGQPPAVPVGAHLMPSGNWVQIIDARTLTRGDKKDLIRQSNIADTTLDRIWVSTDTLLTRLITAWSYPWPIPAEDSAALDRVPLEDDGTISELIADAAALLFPKPVTPDDHDDPESPTAPSGA